MASAAGVAAAAAAGAASAAGGKLEPGRLTVTFWGAEGIRDVQVFGKQDPYAVVQCAGMENKTRVHEDGSKNPVWGDTFFWDLGERDMNGRMLVTIKDSNAGRLKGDKTIGTVSIPLSVFTATPNKAVTHYRDVIHNRKMKGKLKISAKFEEFSAAAKAQAAAAQAAAAAAQREADAIRQRAAAEAAAKAHAEAMAAEQAAEARAAMEAEKARLQAELEAAQRETEQIMAAAAAARAQAEAQAAAMAAEVEAQRQAAEAEAARIQAEADAAREEADRVRAEALRQQEEARKAADAAAIQAQADALADSLVHWDDLEDELPKVEDGALAVGYLRGFAKWVLSDPKDLINMTIGEVEDLGSICRAGKASAWDPDTEGAFAGAMAAMKVMAPKVEYMTLKEPVKVTCSSTGGAWDGKPAAKLFDCLVRGHVQRVHVEVTGRDHGSGESGESQIVMQLYIGGGKTRSSEILFVFDHWSNHWEVNMDENHPLVKAHQPGDSWRFLAVCGTDAGYECNVEAAEMTIVYKPL